ncbi:MAG TPA: cytochrome c3 family protein, partial [Polyangiales bacterium]|nr:cytochrome c3 family protein [Polyangiales bacterium]
VGALAWLGPAFARSVDRELGTARTLEGTQYVGSSACQRCHPNHYESFHRTYHRTMTQEANEASVLGRFDGTSLDYMGTRATMQRGRDGDYWMTFSSIDGGTRRVRVERSVGSHRYQQYLGREGSTYFRLPIAWDVGEQRFIHMNGAFLTADPQPLAADGGIAREDYDRHVTRWNDNCVFCHNVHPNPGLDSDTGEFSTSVAELGVACEACHGPGAEHVARNRDPVRRYWLHESARPDPTIRDPARMSATASAQVCGRCHGQRITSDIARFEHDGDPFVPGDDLGHYSRPLARDTRLNGEAGVFAARFWSDGTPRLTAYEYQGYLQSPCARDSKFSCESCHAMHAGDPSGQLRPDRAGDAICTSCHRALASPLMAAAHRKHDSALTCRQCHMPELVYGLVSVRLSHRIEIPAPAKQAAQGRPDACTLCHVDRTRAWASGARDTTPSEWSEQAERLLAGDPIERAVAAHALGSADAHYAASFEPRLIGLLVDAAQHDAYPAVRRIAVHALRDRLAHDHAGAAAALAGYCATDRATQREAALHRALQDVRFELPDARLAATLRAESSKVAIEIGE